MSQNPENQYQIPQDLYGQTDMASADGFDIAVQETDIIDREVSGEADGHPIALRLIDITHDIIRARKDRIEKQSTITQEVDRRIARSLIDSLFRPGKIVEIKSKQRVKQVTEDDLKHEESLVGGSMYSTGQAGENHKFFCDGLKNPEDPNSAVDWYFCHEVKNAKDGSKKSSIIHYEIHSHEILCVRGISGVLNEKMVYEYISQQEAENLMQAAVQYQELVMRQIYSQTKEAGQKNQIAATDKIAS